MEAMATGRPILAANAAALPHLVHNGENGYLFEPENVDELAQRLEQMFTAEARELRHYAHASLHLIQSHDINTTLDLFEKIYRGEAASLQSVDNLIEYSKPVPDDAILGEMVANLRKSAAALSAAAGELRDGVLERLSDVRGDVVERFEVIGYEVLRRSRKAQKRIERAIARTLDRFRRHDR
jgi:rubrerythrin